MVSKGKISYIRSLGMKKRRDEQGVFVAEGPKVVSELLPVATARLVLATRQWLVANDGGLAGVEAEVLEVSEEELRRASFMQHPQQVLAVFDKKEAPLDMAAMLNSLTIALDGVRDPGNLGTIIRIADWFGIGTVVCGKDCADVYNPKVVQATMGSLARVNVFCRDIAELVAALPDGFPVYGTLLDGEDIYAQTLSDCGVVIMGNEGVGISEEVRRRVNRSLFIPHFPKDRITTDSLNVAVATAVVCSEFRRNKQKQVI